MSNWHHLDDAAAGALRQASQCPKGWTAVNLRSHQMLRLMGRPKPDYLLDHQVLGYTVSWSRKEAEQCVEQLVIQHYERTNNGLHFYLGRNILCADFFFEYPADAVLFKLAI